MSAADFYSLLKSRTFQEVESGKHYRFSNNIINIEGKPVCLYHLSENEEGLVLKCPLTEDILFVNIQEDKPFKITFKEKSKSVPFIVLREVA